MNTFKLNQKVSFVNVWTNEVMYGYISQIGKNALIVQCKSFCFTISFSNELHLITAIS